MVYTALMTENQGEQTTAPPDAQTVAAALEDHADELDGNSTEEKRNFLASEFRKLAARIRGML